MFVEGNMTSDDEKTLLMDQDRIEEASNAAEADYSNDGNHTAHSWDRPTLGTGPFLGQDRPILGTGALLGLMQLR